MDALAPPIRVTDQKELRSIRLYADWDFDFDAFTVFFRPRRLLFSIECDLEKFVSGTLTVAEVTARLVHIHNGASPPSPKYIRRIGIDAIQVIMCKQLDSYPYDNPFETVERDLRRAMRPRGPKLDA